MEPISRPAISANIRRRSIVKGAAWAVPAIVASTAAPAFAASGPCTNRTDNMRVLASDFPAGQTGVVGGQTTTSGILSVTASYGSITCLTNVYSTSPTSYFRQYTVTWTIRNISSARTVSNIALAKPWMATRSFVTPSLGWNVMSCSGVYSANRYWWTGASETCGYLTTNFPYSNGCVSHGGMSFTDPSTGNVTQFGTGRTGNLDVGVGVGTGATMTQGSLSDYPGLIPTTVAGVARINPYGTSNGWTMPSATTPSTFPVYKPTRTTGSPYYDGELDPGETITFTQLLTPESTRSQAYGSVANCNNTNDTFEGVIVLGNVC